MDRTSPGITRRTVILIVLAGVGVVLLSVLVPIQSLLYGTVLPASFLLGAAICGAPVLSVVLPRVAIALFAAAAFVLPLIASADHDPVWPWPWSVPALIAFAVLVGAVTFLHGWLPGLITLLVNIAGSLVAALLVPSAADPTAMAADLIVASSIAAVAFLVALLVSGRVRIGEELNRERQVSATEQSRRLLVEERTRIARELHDVVAHSMSVIQVQASTAKYRVPGLADEATAEFDDIAATARASLVEMRRLLGVLRTEDQVAELTPQQGIADLPALAESLRRVGADITLQVTDTDGAEVPPSVQIAAFRIVQEGMSNAVRHAPGAPVAVDVRVDDAAVHLRIHNGASRSAGEHGAGHGLRGMLERAELLGGSLSAGPDGEGGWLVVATLPVAVSSEPRTSTPSSPSRPVSTKDRP
ncbi:sensor histidine kinase [Plantibacter cousiniae]|uniref:histidine kinase n=1 Tax=Plantibacter cousiniae (nom. nud.) TaxID=199709 RepID=A0ABY1LGY4_9MICO|nr:histidine kinase [Plantibacter cousiniae]SKC39488.1 Signal transduction histidine kinase [Plantibacter cousiniae]